MVGPTSILHLVCKGLKKGDWEELVARIVKLSWGGFSKINNPGISWMCVTQRETV